MLTRAYSVSYQARYPTYVGCSVQPEWLSFESFKAWMERQPWQGADLDKDLLYPGNKIYGEDFCVMVPQWLNKFFNSNRAQRGSLPIGVTKRLYGRYAATVERDGRCISLGSFGAPDEAHRAYRVAKAGLAVELIGMYASQPKHDGRVISAIQARIDHLLDFSRAWDGT